MQIISYNFSDNITIFSCGGGYLPTDECNSNQGILTCSCSTENCNKAENIIVSVTAIVMGVILAMVLGKWSALTPHFLIQFLIKPDVK